MEKIIFGIWATFVIGWGMNIQNLFQYWPESNTIGDAGIEWIVSLICVFVAPLGSILGFIW